MFRDHRQAIAHYAEPGPDPQVIAGAPATRIASWAPGDAARAGLRRAVGPLAGAVPVGMNRFRVNSVLKKSHLLYRNCNQKL